MRQARRITALNKGGLVRILGAASLVTLAGCSPEMGRRVNDTDISCLRAQMGGTVHQSFPLAANTCQRMTGRSTFYNADKAKPVPLNLAGAPDMQKLADEYGYSYTTTPVGR